MESLASLHISTNMVIGFDVDNATHDFAHHDIDVAQIIPVLVMLFDQARCPGAREGDEKTRCYGAAVWIGVH